MISKTTPQPSAATAAGRPPAVGGFALLAGVMAAAALSIPMTAAAATPTHRVRVAAQRSVPVKPNHGRPSTAPNRPKQARRGVHARIASACGSTAPDVYLRTLNYNTTWVGGSLRLDATTSCDIGPSPFYTELYDATTGTYLKVCGTGTDCYANVSQAVATTHRFMAYVTTSRDYGFPPATMQRYSNPTWITWSNSGWQTALISYQGNTTFTAFANRDVGLTPYRIEIYEFTYDQGGHITTNTLLKACGSGTACTLANAPYAGKGLVAFIAHRHISLLGAYYGTVVEPNDIQANSEVQQEVHPIG